MADWVQDTSKSWKEVWRRKDDETIVVAEEGRRFHAYIDGSFNNCVTGPQGCVSAFKTAKAAMAAADIKWPFYFVGRLL